MFKYIEYIESYFTTRKALNIVHSLMKIAPLPLSCVLGKRWNLIQDFKIWVLMAPLVRFIFSTLHQQCTQLTVATLFQQLTSWTVLRNRFDLSDARDITMCVKLITSSSTTTAFDKHNHPSRAKHIYVIGQTVTAIACGKVACTAWIIHQRTAWICTYGNLQNFE